MSEVKRYGMSGFGGGMIEMDDGPFVNNEDFDTQRLRADMAEAENHDLRLQCGGMEMDLQAAEQRIARHEGMLRHFASCADVRRVGTSAMDYVAALNPNP